ANAVARVFTPLPTACRSDENRFPDWSRPRSNCELSSRRTPYSSPTFSANAPTPSGATSESGSMGRLRRQIPRQPRRPRQQTQDQTTQPRPRPVPHRRVVQVHPVHLEQVQHDQAPPVEQVTPLDRPLRLVPRLQLFRGLVRPVERDAGDGGRRLPFAVLRPRFEGDGWSFGLPPPGACRAAMI